MGQKWVKPFNIFAREIVNGIRKSGIKCHKFRNDSREVSPNFFILCNVFESYGMKRESKLKNIRT